MIDRIASYQSLLVLLLLAGCGHKNQGILLTFTNPNPVCGAVITEPCAQTVTVTDVTANAIVLGNSKLAGPEALSTYEITPMPPAGKHTYQVVFDGTDEKGDKGTSPATAQFETEVTVP